MRKLFDQRELVGSWLRVYSKTTSLGLPDNSHCYLEHGAMRILRYLVYHLMHALVEEAEYLLTLVYVVKVNFASSSSTNRPVV